ncbi:MAG: hypothetical protein JSW60_09165, partial [Thermoplasmatales archaeon]
IYIDEFIELRKSDVDHCIEYIRKNFSPDADTDKEILNKLAFQIKGNVFRRVICDVSKLDFVRDATRVYLKNFCLSFLASLGARVFAVVTGENEEKKKYYQELATEMSEIIDEWNLQSGFFDDMDTAREWIVDK